MITDNPAYPHLHDLTAPFVYARLQCASEAEATGYPVATLELWADRARTWASGGAPADLECLAPAARKAARARDVFIFMINGFKPRAPAAAMRLIERLA